jgi:GntR family transcriptional regulator / MocR family aminotransferase
MAEKEPVSPTPTPTPSPGPELLLSLEPGRGPLHEQLELSLREQVRTGRLAPGSRVPSSRALAAELGISRGVVLEAYGQLVAEGYFLARQGAPTRVAGGQLAELAPLAAGWLEPRYQYRFDPSLPDLGSFPRDRWLRSLRTALRQAPFDALGSGDPRGVPELRNALMGYLGRARGAAPEPEHTLICAGFTQGLALICACLHERGVERIAIEDPGWARHRLVAERTGLEAVPIPVDDQGLDVSGLAASGCEAVVVTPAHQFPTGVVMSSERRAALLGWADDMSGLIVEDDYDSELRYDRGPVGALQGLAPERVCHVGSVSKRLLPSLRLGWMLCPSWLTGELTFAKGIADGGSPALDQLALADFITRGELDRHLRRMRIRYRDRRAIADAALATALPEAKLAGIAAGLYTLVLLPEGASEPAASRAAAAAGVWVEGLSSHQVLGRDQVGFILGYANVSEPAIKRGVALLGAAVTSV